jgi:hypothetical protein
MNRTIPFALLTLAAAAAACSFNVDLGPSPEPGPEIVDEIAVPVPGSGASETDPARLRLEFGAGELILNPGGSARLVDGTATYNIRDFRPQIDQDDLEVRIRQGDYEFITAPTLRNLKNVWDLELGAVPMDLTIRAGAYKGRMELGGLSLTSLTVEDGAAEVELAFSEPNLGAMSVLQYRTGASNISLRGLANANFHTMVFDSGAGNYTLDFSGELQQDATVSLSSGLSNVTLVIPEGVRASIAIDGGLTNVSPGPDWERRGDAYTQAGTGPTLTILVEMGAGNLTITD